MSSSQSIIVATAVLHNIACNFGERIPRVTNEVESEINITNFCNPDGENMGGRNTVNINNNIRKKLLRYFQNVV